MHTHMQYVHIGKWKETIPRISKFNFNNIGIQEIYHALLYYEI